MEPPRLKRRAGRLRELGWTSQPSAEEERVGQMERGAGTWKHVVVGICLVVGLLHFVAGPGYGGPCPRFVRGYLIDILLPLALFLLLGVSWRVLADSRLARALVVLAVGGTVEGLQYLGLPVSPSRGWLLETKPSHLE